MTNLPDKGIFAWECNFVCENFPLPVKTIDSSDDAGTKYTYGTLLFKSKATMAKENKVFNKYTAQSNKPNSEKIPLGDFYHTHFIFLNENDEKVIAGPLFLTEAGGKDYELDEYGYTTAQMTVQYESRLVEVKEVCLVPFHVFDHDKGSYFVNKGQESPYAEDGSPAWPIITLEPIDDYKEAYDDTDELLNNTLDLLWAIQHAEIVGDVIRLSTNRPKNWPPKADEKE